MSTKQTNKPLVGFASSHPLRQLEVLDERLDARIDSTGPSRWMIPYADLLTLLLGFFIVLFAVAQQEVTKMKHPTERMVTAKTANALRDRVKKLEAELEKRPATMVDLATAPETTLTEADLLKQLKLSGSQIVVRHEKRGLVLSFQERLFFQPGKANLEKPAAQTLDRLAAVLVDLRQPIRVEGHTDNTPIKTASFPSNWELSTARATNILKYLVERHHFPPQRIAAAGYGEYYPMTNNSTNEGKRKNRRVDIVVLNAASGASDTPTLQPDPAADAPDSPDATE